VPDHVPSGKRLQILQLLITHGKLTGGEMLEHDPSLPRGTIYTTLRRLQDDKLVSSRVDAETGEAGPPRRFYQITALGKRAAKLGEIAEAVMAGARLITIPGGRL
jgi:DNA-binding PadR family transcriptional regulator